MHHIVPMQSGHDGVVHAGEASATLSRIEDVLDRDEEGSVVLDFTGVGRLSPSAIDILLTPLFDRLGEALPDRVFFDACAASVLADLREMAEAGRAVATTAPPERPAAQGWQAA